jgi:hypothetical protein
MSQFDLRIILRYAVGLLLILIPWYPKFPLVAVAGTYVQIRLEDWVILGVAGLWLVYIMPQIGEFLKKPLTRVVVIYWLVGFLSLVSAVLVTKTVVPHLGILHTLRRVEYVILMLVVATTIKSWEDVRFYLQVMVVAVLLVFGYGLGQKFLGWPVISTMNKEFAKGVALPIAPGDRINSTFAGHYDLAAWSLVILNVLAGWLVAMKRGKERWMVLVAIVGGFWLLLASASRISFAAYLGSIVLTLWFLRRRWWIPPVVVVSVALSLLTPSLTARYAEVVRYEFVPRLASISLREYLPFKPEKVAMVPTPTPEMEEVEEVGPGGVVTKKKRPKPTVTLTPTPVPLVEARGESVEYAPSFEDRSTAIRFNVEWPRALRALAKNPLLGTGYSSITLATDNDYLRLLGEVGLLGFGAFGLIFGWLLVRVKDLVLAKGPIDERRAVVIGIMGAVLGFGANAMFIDVFEASKVASYFWILVGVMVGVGNIRIQNTEYRIQNTE